MQTVAFHTLGCKLNFSETSAIARQFLMRVSQRQALIALQMYMWLIPVQSHKRPTKKCRKIIKQALRHNPDGYIVVVGCYAQLKPQEIANIPGVDLLWGAGDKFRITTLVEDFTKTHNPCVYNTPIQAVDEFCLRLFYWRPDRGHF